MNETPKTKFSQRMHRVLPWFLTFIATVFVLAIVVLISHPHNVSFFQMIFILCIAAVIISFPLLFFVHWIRCWKNIRRALIGLAVIATLIAIFYTEEDWRGKHAWQSYKHEWEAKGEKFDWQSFVPADVPPAQNFFRASIFTNMLTDKIVMTPYGNDGGPSAPSDQDLPNSETGSAGPYPERMNDLKMWQNYYRNPTNLHAVVVSVRANSDFQEQTNHFNHPVNQFPIMPEAQTPAKDVLFALSKYDSAIEQLREASQRPYANVPLDYENGFNAASELLPYLAVLKRCTQTLQLRADAELANGQSAKALEDVKLMLYLNNSLRTSPFLISHLVRIAIVAIDMQTVWEGLAEHKWSDEQLASLDAELAKTDFLADYGFIMRGERAFAIKSFENQRLAREIISYTDAGVVTNRLTFMPSAYFYQNELAIAQMQQQWILPLVNTNSRTVSIKKLKESNDTVRARTKHYSPYKVQSLMLFPAFSAMVRRIAMVQSSMDLARVACALERYHLGHGEYPETLDALVPQFMEKIPHDIIGGQPLHYQRTTDGKFLLYSIGWNETDDGGVESGKDFSKGDWVWKN